MVSLETMGKRSISYAKQRIYSPKKAGAKDEFSQKALNDIQDASADHSIDAFIWQQNDNAQCSSKH